MHRALVTIVYHQSKCPQCSPVQGTDIALALHIEGSRLPNLHGGQLEQLHRFCDRYWRCRPRSTRVVGSSNQSVPSTCSHHAKRRRSIGTVYHRFIGIKKILVSTSAMSELDKCPLWRRAMLTSRIEASSVTRILKVVICPGMTEVGSKAAVFGPARVNSEYQQQKFGGQGSYSELAEIETYSSLFDMRCLFKTSTTVGLQAW